MASTYATFTNNTVPSTSKFTWSAWVKRGKLGTQQALFSGAQSSTTGQMIYFNGASDQLGFYGIASSTVRVDKYTTRKFRDVNAWYHIVVAYDSTLSTASDRVKFYVNGELQQLNGTDVQVQGWEPYYMLTSPTDIGRDAMGTSSYFDGEISHMNFVIGTVYDATAFGETDSTTGEWKGKTSPSVTYGSDGFFILKDGNGITDQSGEGNDFTLGGGTLTDLKDNPDNVFCTLSPLHKLGTNTGTYSNGNTKYADANSNWQGTMCTLGATSGKYYWEYQLVAGTYHMIGVMPDNVNLISSSVFDTIGGYSAYIDNGYIEARYNNADISGWSKSDLGNTSFSTNDYINLAVDMDNKFMYIGKNGTWFKSGDPTSGSSGTGGINVSATFTSGVFMIPVISAYNGTTGQFNFGNGYFGTTAVASAGTNASDNGIFEYDVPTGYTALSTKGLNL